MDDAVGPPVRRDRSPADGPTWPEFLRGLHGVFKADGDETKRAYSILKWWLEPRTQGPGAHAEDDVFYVIEGTMSFLIEDRWIDASRGSFVLAPAGVTHGFRNRSSDRAGVLNVSIPGDFEQHMPGIVSWFAEHPPQDAP
jgi:mannose-6-phosphate isomerase-like protein (cupin superfamily)